MKLMKKTLSVIIALTMLLSMMSINAFAADNHIVTITSKTDGHTYQAYQIFAGSYSETGSNRILSNVTWGNGVDGSGLLAALKSDATYNSYFTSCTTPAQVAEAIGNIPALTFADDFAKIVAQFLTTTHKDSTTPTGSNPYTYSITGLPDGYYFINETSFSGTVGNAYTKYLLQVVDDVTVAAKTDSPAIAKKVKENNDPIHKDSWNDAADYSIGDNVPFRIVGLVPNMRDFQTYYYKITDTLSSGLTFNESSVKVYYVLGTDMYAAETNNTTPGAGGTLLTSDKYHLATTSGGFTIEFNNLKSTAGVQNNGFIVVEYTAALNSNAVIDNPGNPNEVYLTYSNNPNSSELGAANEHGTTPKDEVVVYTFKLPVTKQDGNHTNLAGATFALFADLKDASAAVSNPTSPTAINRALTFTGSDGNYTLSSTGTVRTLVDASGVYAIKGLDQGTYYLVELTEPSGYNRLLEPFTVSVAPTYNTSEYVNAHILDADDQLTAVKVNGSSNVTVINRTGSTLPETGGIGTTIFTVIGIILMLGAAVLFITKRKMSSQKDL